MTVIIGIWKTTSVSTVDRTLGGHQLRHQLLIQVNRGGWQKLLVNMSVNAQKAAHTWLIDTQRWTVARTAAKISTLAIRYHVMAIIRIIKLGIVGFMRAGTNQTQRHQTISGKLRI